MSVTFESTAPGIAADIMKMQNLPVSFFSTALQKLNSGDDAVIIDVYTEEDHALSSFWETRGVKTVYMYPIRCLEDGFIGILCVDFIKKDGFLTEAINKSFKNEASILSGYISSISIEKDLKLIK
jgi:hypothetical protein